VDKKGINNLLAPMQSKILYVKGTKNKNVVFPIKKNRVFIFILIKVDKFGLIENSNNYVSWFDSQKKYFRSFFNELTLRKR
jgi:hypothetical protein